MTILGVCGKARSGKNQFTMYLRNILESEHGRVFVERAFADSLKEMCKNYFHLSYDQLWGDEKEIPDRRYPRYIKPYCSGLGKSKLPASCWTPREIMQEIGSFFRSIDYDFWVRYIARDIELGYDKDIIMTDVRHINECEFIKEHGILIRIIRNDASEIHGMQHESETALDDKSDDYFDITIENNGTLEDLQIAAYHAAKMVLELEQIKEKGRQYNG